MPAAGSKPPIAEVLKRLPIATFLWNCTLAGLLLVSVCLYQESSPVSRAKLACSVGGLALGALLLRCHRPPGNGAKLHLIHGAKFFGVFMLGVLTWGLLFFGSDGGGAISHGMWISAAFALSLFTSERLLARIVYDRDARAREGEMARWIILLAVATWLASPLITGAPTGAGDAYWYKLMLTDFTLQVRQIGLPVWVGQTEYAFSGPVLPLRMAPWFQHLGALMDLITGRTLGPIALNNLVLASCIFASAFTSYFCTRAVTHGKHWIAAITSIIYTCSPGIISPLIAGDQYMTFMTAPMLPVGTYALWQFCRNWRLRDALLLSGAAAAMWLAHPPIGLCFSLLSALGILIASAICRRLEWKSLTLALTFFGCAASFPFISVALLGLDPAPPTNRASELASIAQSNLWNFPKIFFPIGEKIHLFAPYQPGYGALALLLVGAVGFCMRPRLANGVILFLAGITIVFVMPVESLSKTVWSLVPSQVIAVLNVWPIQRLLGIFVVISLLVGATTLGEWVAAWRTRISYGAVTLLLVCGAGWTIHQAGHLRKSLINSTPPNDSWRREYALHNLMLTRYSFGTFRAIPSYFSHGYMEPRLEHRFLRLDHSIAKDNALSAATAATPSEPGATLLTSGTLRAINLQQTETYRLEPQLNLPANQHLALRLDPMAPGQTGWLQFLGRDIFREYLLPDSGIGFGDRTNAASFGTLRTSSHVLPLYTRAENEAPLQFNIRSMADEDHQDFDFARYELWTYNPQDLPINVTSWVPYRILVNANEDGYVETPRLWLPGYRARVNGRTVQAVRSNDHRVMIPVPAGYSDITIKYVPPLVVEISYWIGIVTWLLISAGGVTWLVFPRLLTQRERTTC
jgi:hypothetical protein